MLWREPRRHNCSVLAGTWGMVLTYSAALIPPAPDFSHSSIHSIGGSRSSFEFARVEHFPLNAYNPVNDGQCRISKELHEPFLNRFV